MSDTDRYILIEIARGRTNSEIGQTLHLVEGTVKNRVSGLMDKLQCENRAALAAYAIENGIEQAVIEEEGVEIEEEEDTTRGRLVNHMSVRL